MVGALGVEPGDTVVEIGPGRGALTQDLARVSDRLILIEKDDALASMHAIRFADDPRVTVVAADATEVDLETLLPPGVPVRVIGNLPYNAGGPILFHFLAHRHRFTRLVLMFQREVALRLVASAGDRAFGAVSILAQVRANVRHLFDVSPEKFQPKPKVWSAVVAADPRPYPHPLALEVDDPAFGRLVHALHAQPRKTVLNSLSNGLQVGKGEVEAWLRGADIALDTRPSTVSIDQALDLFGVWSGR
jgi:16S rRNA (adenine1518-N6/adenine1519-N6)-dimethyltransferase